MHSNVGMQRIARQARRMAQRCTVERTHDWAIPLNGDNGLVERHGIHIEVAQLVVGSRVDGDLNQTWPIVVQCPFESRQQIVGPLNAKAGQPERLGILDEIRIGERRGKGATKAPLLIELAHATGKSIASHSL